LTNACGILDSSIVAEYNFDIVAGTANVNGVYQIIHEIDGAAHTIKLQYKTSAGTFTVTNSSATNRPRIVFKLTPSQ
jgi:hypothetical protein